MYVTALCCARCDARHDPGQPVGTCACGGPLLVDYDLAAVAGATDPPAIGARPPTMWRYRELLPVADPDATVTLGEGFTPLLRMPARLGFADLWLKDEGTNPTGTFKARGAACGMSRARELGARDVVLPSAGNAGGAWACYGAAAGVRVHVVMPASAPAASILECRMYGAELTVVEGLLDAAGRAAAAMASAHGWYDAATLHEPYRVEGKKTLGFEIAEQLGGGHGWRLPDAIVCPVGGGVGLIGIWRALEMLRALDWVQGDTPRLIAVQAAGCAPVVRAAAEGADACEPWEGAATMAAGLCVPDPPGGALVLRAIRATGGTAVAVSDADIAGAMRQLARGAGVFAAPEAAATLAAAEVLAERGDLERGARIVLLSTGSGLKAAEAARTAVTGD